MGFYLPAQIVRDAINHGVEIRPVCINSSRWDCTLEPVGGEGRFAVRLGMRLVKGLANDAAAAIIAARADQPFASADDLWHRAGVPAASLVQLAEADALRPSLGLARREALWLSRNFLMIRSRCLPQHRNGSGAPSSSRSSPAVSLRPMMTGRVVEDYGHVGLTLREHPLAFLRESLGPTTHRLLRRSHGRAGRARLEAAGLVLVRQRPGSAKGVMFVTRRTRPAPPTSWCG